MIFALLALLSSASLEQRTASCRTAEPVRVTLAELNARMADFEGRCVTTSGRLLAGALVGGGELQKDYLPRDRLGVYDEPPYGFLKAAPDRKTWEVTGVVSTCDALYQEVVQERARSYRPLPRIPSAPPPPPPPPVMLAGFCHYYSGPFVWLASSRPLPEPNQ